MHVPREILRDLMERHPPSTEFFFVERGLLRRTGWAGSLNDLREAVAAGVVGASELGDLPGDLFADSARWIAVPSSDHSKTRTQMAAYRALLERHGRSNEAYRLSNDAWLAQGRQEGCCLQTRDDPDHGPVWCMLDSGHPGPHEPECPDCWLANFVKESLATEVRPSIDLRAWINRAALLPPTDWVVDASTDSSFASSVDSICEAGWSDWQVVHLRVEAIPRSTDLLRGIEMATGPSEARAGGDYAMTVAAEVNSMLLRRWVQRAKDSEDPRLSKTWLEIIDAHDGPPTGALFEAIWAILLRRRLSVDVRAEKGQPFARCVDPAIFGLAPVAE